MNTSKAFSARGMKSANLYLRKARLMLVFKIHFQREWKEREHSGSCGEGKSKR